jgi:hypothetical protein
VLGWIGVLGGFGRWTGGRKDRCRCNPRSGSAKAHAAIFSLGTDAPTRAVPLPDFPRLAIWKTYKQFYLYSSDIDPKTGKTVWTPEPDQQGEVWQAEERLEKGKWKRYYGFVGAHVVAMVPAEEIELVTPDAPATRP